MHANSFPGQVKQDRSMWTRFAEEQHDVTTAQAAGHNRCEHRGAEDDKTSTLSLRKRKHFDPK